MALTAAAESAAAEAAEAAEAAALGLPMTKLHTGWFGSSALVINDVVAKEVGDVVVSSMKCEAVVLDAAGCDVLTHMIERKDIKGALRRVKLLDSLSVAEIDALAAVVVSRQVWEGDVLIRQGETTGSASDTFYIIHQGEVAITKDMNDGEPHREIIRLHGGEHFGERALLSQADDVRTANCVATTDGFVFTVNREAFETHLGPLREIINRHDTFLKEIERAKDITLGELRMMATVGMGTFGRVRLVEHSGTRKTYALKSMSKEKIVRYQQEQHVRNECLLMRKISHPFCARLIKTFKDHMRVHMLLEATMGGELFRYLDMEPSGSFPESWWGDASRNFFDP